MLSSLKAYVGLLIQHTNMERQHFDILPQGGETKVLKYKIYYNQLYTWILHPPQVLQPLFSLCIYCST